MTCAVRPSDIYRKISTSGIERYLNIHNLCIVAFRLVETGDNVLHYNNGILTHGPTKVECVGYVRFIVVDRNGIEDFWE